VIIADAPEKIHLALSGEILVVRTKDQRSAQSRTQNGTSLKNHGEWNLKFQKRFTEKR
jgi:hypothetical protein